MATAKANEAHMEQNKRKMRALFDIWDADNSGALDKREALARETV